MFSLKHQFNTIQRKSLTIYNMKVDSKAIFHMKKLRILNRIMKK